MGAEADFSATANQKLYREQPTLGEPHKATLHSKARVAPPRGLLEHRMRRSGKYEEGWHPAVAGPSAERALVRCGRGREAPRGSPLRNRGRAAPSMRGDALWQCTSSPQLTRQRNVGGVVGGALRRCSGVRAFESYKPGLELRTTFEPPSCTALRRSPPADVLLSVSGLWSACCPLWTQQASASECWASPSLCTAAQLQNEHTSGAP